MVVTALGFVLKKKMPIDSSILNQLTLYNERKTEIELTKALIGGKPIADNKLYGVATISFLLYGGDSLTLAENAVNMQVFDDEVIDIVLAHLDVLKQEGKNITAPTVKYVTVK